jgi:hypothetical protein
MRQGEDRGDEMAKPCCFQCGRKLALGERFRNLWNGEWWLRLRFCSSLCENNYELEHRRENAGNRWISYPHRGSA